VDWVVVQFVLMAVGLASGPLWPSQWEGEASLVGGALFLALAALTGLLGKRDLGNSRTVFPRPKDDARLVTLGIYAWVRHPLYVSVLCTGFGWALLWRSWPAVVIAVLQVPFFDAKARREERWLCERHADYANYMRRVKRFIPGFY
jgi:protein-S-isoprenylcysteine O-methyltransferase Ste14